MSPTLPPTERDRREVRAPRGREALSRRAMSRSGTGACAPSGPLEWSYAGRVAGAMSVSGAVEESVRLTLALARIGRQAAADGAASSGRRARLPQERTDDAAVQSAFLHS